MYLLEWNLYLLSLMAYKWKAKKGTASIVKVEKGKYILMCIPYLRWAMKINTLYIKSLISNESQCTK